MKKIQNIRWSDHGKEANLGDLLRFIMNTIDIMNQPRGLEAGRKYSEFINAFKSDEEYIVLDDAVYKFGNDIITKFIPSAWYEDENIKNVLLCLDKVEDISK